MIHPALPALDGIERLTDSCGIVQHTVFGVADRSHGYCLDDNARALILVNHLARNGGRSVQLERLAHTYAAFVQHSWNEQKRTFRNFLSFERVWCEDAGSQDSFGRAFWSLGTTVAHGQTDQLRSWASALAARAFESASQLEAPRARAFAILGYCGLLNGAEFSSAARIGIKRHARVVSGMLEERCDTEWPWFEDCLTYENARLPQGLIFAGLALSDQSLVSLGAKSLAWLCEQQLTPGGLFRPIGTESFELYRQITGDFDQQPVEAAATIDAALAAHTATEDPTWLDIADRAFTWFFGNNLLSRPLADPATGLCFDGLTRHGLNLNQGAESLLSFCMASVALSGICKQEDPNKGAFI